MTDPSFPPVFATNRPSSDDLPGETVAEKLILLFKTIREQAAPAPISIATAYINADGFSLIADELSQVPRVRLLLGAEPDPAKSHRSQQPLTRDQLTEVVSEHADWLAYERDLTGFTRIADASARRLVDWLTAAGTGPEVEVRRYTKGFLHGKAYISDHEAFSHTLAGSSNLTYAGLARNAELNLGYPATEYTRLVQDWFDRLWNDSEPFDLAGMYEARWQPHTPWVVFLRMLWELYGDSADDDLETAMHLTGFQREGVARMLRILEELGGVIVADEVGLGKTFMAAEVMKRATEQHRQRVLIVCPAPLRAGMWEPFLDRFDMSRRIKVMSYEELRNRWQGDETGEFRAWLDEFALVVIDEAHNLRNPAAQRSGVVSALVGGANPKQVVLLTATPVNNSLMDLHALVRYFVRDDARFANIGMPSIKEHIEHAQRLDPDTLSPEHLFDLIDQVAVRRTRRFIKTHYQGDTIPGDDGERLTIVFPTPVLHRLDYELDDDGLRLLDAMTYALDSPADTTGFGRREDDEDRLILARYLPSAYRKGETKPDGMQVHNVGLLRNALLKRLESSPAALAATLGNLIAAHMAFLAALGQGKVLTGDALREWTSADDEDLDEFLLQLDDDRWTGVDSIELYDHEALASDVSEDLAVLERLKGLADIANADLDIKAAHLAERLRQIATKARAASADGLPSSDRRKTIVFSTFTDTIKDLHHQLSEVIAEAPVEDPISDFKDRIAPPIFGSKTGIEQEGRARTLAGFAPETAGLETSTDRYDLLLTTDVLSEGVNLQQAGRIVNYDLPWNPMRIVQRHGRIDRIGSKHPRVYLDCFFPAQHLDALLSLEARLHRKLAQADAAIGVGDVIPGFRGTERVFADAHETIRQIAAEDVSVLDGGPGALSGEEYRRLLKKATQPSTLADQVRNLPWGAGSGFVNPKVTTNGFAFCTRIEGVEKPVFRFVSTDEEWRVLHNEEGTPDIDRHTLIALAAADPGGDATERHLPAMAYEAAFDAWDVAQNDIHAEWQLLADPANLQPKVPKALRSAAQLVADHGAFLGNGVQQSLYGRLLSVPPHSVEVQVREVVNSDDDARDKVAALAALADEVGLEAPPPPPRIDSVDLPQIHLVAWMAVSRPN